MRRCRCIAVVSAGGGHWPCPPCFCLPASEILRFTWIFAFVDYWNLLSHYKSPILSTAADFFICGEQSANTRLRTSGLNPPCLINALICLEKMYPITFKICQLKWQMCSWQFIWLRSSSHLNIELILFNYILSVLSVINMEEHWVGWLNKNKSMYINIKLIFVYKKRNKQMFSSVDILQQQQHYSLHE